MNWITITASVLCAGYGAGEVDPAEPPKLEAHPPRLASSTQAASEERVEEKNELLEFTYVWPASAAAIPKLNKKLEAEMEALRADSRKTAEEDKEGRPADLPFHGHYLSKVWDVYGQNDRLLSLGAPIESFTGGAHGNLAFDSMIWDRREDRAISFSELFSDASAAMTKLTPDYCSALDAERSVRREEPLPLQGDDWMTGCPTLADQVVVPGDHDGDGKFDRLSILIPPYEAGPYAEGAYPIEVPMTLDFIALVKPAYSGSFEQGSRPAAASAQPQ